MKSKHSRVGRSALFSLPPKLSITRVAATLMIGAAILSSSCGGGSGGGSGGSGGVGGIGGDGGTGAMATDSVSEQGCQCAERDRSNPLLRHLGLLAGLHLVHRDGD